MRPLEGERGGNSGPQDRLQLEERMGTSPEAQRPPEGVAARDEDLNQTRQAAEQPFLSFLFPSSSFLIAGEGNGSPGM